MSDVSLTPPPKTYSVKEVAALLGFEQDVIYQAIRLGQLPVRRVSGSIRIPRKAFRLWLREAPCEIRGEPVSCTRNTSRMAPHPEGTRPAMAAGRNNAQRRNRRGEEGVPS